MKQKTENPKSEKWYLSIRPAKAVSFAFSLISLFFAFIFISLMLSLFFGPIPSGNIAVIPIEGVITGSGYGYSVSASSPDIVQIIKEADQNPKIKAIILEINSGGGSPVGSDEIAAAVKSAQKPTVAVIREVGASGAYWVASAADKIYANRMSLTGSISVIGDYLEFAGLISDYNITYRLFTSGKYKSMGSPFKELSEEEAEIFQKNVDRIHEYFVEAIAENRNMPVEKVRAAATGEAFLGAEAKELGLVDELGSMDDAVRYLENQLNITAEIARYSQKKSIYSLLSAKAGSISGLVFGEKDFSVKA